MKKFEYIKRDSCVCGLDLLESEDRKHVRKNLWGDVTFVQCGGCGSWCQSPQISPLSLAQWYDSEAYWGGRAASGEAYTNYQQDEKIRLVEGRNRYVTNLAGLLPEKGGRVLEVGCASGSLLAVVREFGHRVKGIDVSSKLTKEARRLYGLDVIEADLLSASLEKTRFDMVILFGTISTLWDIPRSLKIIKSSLKPGGVLVFNFPACDSVVAKIYGKRFWMFTPSVGTFLSTDGCDAALRDAGFKSFEMQTDRQMPSLTKLFHHAKMPFMNKIMQSILPSVTFFPFPLPIPGIMLITART